MKINKKIRSNVYRLISLRVPKKKIREYIEGAYNCPGRLYCIPQALSTKLEKLSKEKVSSEKAVSELDEMFETIFSNIGIIEENNPISQIHF